MQVVAAVHQWPFNGLRSRLVWRMAGKNGLELFGSPAHCLYYLEWLQWRGEILTWQIVTPEVLIILSFFSYATFEVCGILNPLPLRLSLNLPLIMWPISAGLVNGLDLYWYYHHDLCFLTPTSASRYHSVWWGNTLCDRHLSSWLCIMVGNNWTCLQFWVWSSVFDSNLIAILVQTLWIT